MPFVIPSILVPSAVNSTQVEFYWVYAGTPDESRVQEYVAWLKNELSLCEEWLSICRPKPEEVTS